ncbi:GntR family transcriptional regulator [Actinoplanes derwentensis]|uniref:DNA-binding transcriptional regulator, GntR family n=1 Tax=Actinoplanes derwentensis TaxID=113562 RepID=A0A1H2BIM9_9ACTN|nr:GntR family transcriptional regulator [Actinoplanes derwentensis]GID90393.1 GntR family transcriptional regulator [Actinoplanes derwentensis]SDT58190.1 DNA-binding transcriptional regulator, GntR family [Actinoplanes derwentensis]
MIRRSVLSDDVHESLKSLIMDHRLAPEDRLNIDALARELQVSPTPVREALARLESEGLVRKRPLAGYTVSPLLTRDEFNQMFDMRMVLEGPAARWAAEHATAEQRAAVTTEAALPFPAPQAGQEHALFTARDARFHDLVAAGAANPLLRDAITRLHAHLHIHRLYFPYTETHSTLGEHDRVAAAVGSGDPAGAEAAMLAHLSAARTRHLRVFD